MFKQLHSSIRTTVHHISFSLKNWHHNAGFPFTGIPFPSKTHLQNCNITSSAILLLATTISVVTLENHFHCYFRESRSLSLFHFPDRISHFLARNFLYWLLNHGSVHLVVPSIFLIHNSLHMFLPYFKSIFLTETNSSSSTLNPFSSFNIFSIPFHKFYEFENLVWFFM